MNHMFTNNPWCDLTGNMILFVCVSAASIISTKHTETRTQTSWVLLNSTKIYW